MIESIYFVIKSIPKNSKGACRSAFINIYSGYLFRDKYCERHLICKRVGLTMLYLTQYKTTHH